MSPKDSPRALYGWVWQMDPKRCGVGIKVRRDAAGAMVNGPEMGDVLVSRADFVHRRQREPALQTDCRETYQPT